MWETERTAHYVQEKDKWSFVIHRIVKLWTFLSVFAKYSVWLRRIFRLKCAVCAGLGVCIYAVFLLILPSIEWKISRCSRFLDAITFSRSDFSVCLWFQRNFVDDTALMMGWVAQPPAIGIFCSAASISICFWQWRQTTELMMINMEAETNKQ